MSVRTRTLSKHLTVSAVAAGTAVELLAGRPRGTIEQVVIRAASGGGADGNVAISLNGASGEEDLAYKYTAAPWPFIDSSIAGPFDCTQASAADALTLILAPASDGVFEIRVDFRLDK